MDSTFSVLGLTAHAYGLCASAAALVLLGGMAILARRRRMPAGLVAVFGLLGIPLGIVCARALYCAFHLSDFWETYENPWLMLRFFDGGLSMPGLLAGLALAAVLTAKLMKVRPAAVLDVMCIPLGLSIALLRLGEQFTDLGVGKAVEESALTAAMPWLFLQSRMGVAVVYRLNVWAYEAVAGVLIFAATLAASRWLSRREHSREGDTALFFMALLGASQILLESLRDDGHMLVIFLRVGQLAAAVMTVAAAAVLSARCARLAGGKARLWLGWGVMLLCMAGVVLLEFSLDGRLSWGEPSMGRDYALMAVLCAGIFAVPASLLRAVCGGVRACRTQGGADV